MAFVWSFPVCKLSLVIVSRCVGGCLDSTIHTIEVIIIIIKLSSAKKEKLWPGLLSLIRRRGCTIILCTVTVSADVILISG